MVDDNIALVLKNVIRRSFMLVSRRNWNIQNYNKLITYPALILHFFFILYERSGSWILLSNLQLALNWLPRLDSILRSPVCTTQKHSNTKIWLTTEECSGFYQGLSGLCLKLAYEPPEGVKRNVKQSLLQLRQRQPPLRDQGTMLLISWLHAILQERRK